MDNKVTVAMTFNGSIAGFVRPEIITRIEQEKRFSTARSTVVQDEKISFSV